MIANALKENPNMKLTYFSAGRDRLENKGIKSLAEAFKQMGSLQVIEVPQNGIKKEGMMALMECLKYNADNIREIYVHDNWIKNEAVDLLAEFILKAKTLKVLNISDSTMGSESVYLVVSALAQSKACETLE